MTLQCYNHHGHETTLEAIRDRYGPLYLQDADPPADHTGLVYRLVEIHERRQTYGAIETFVLDVNDRGIHRLRVAWYWPDAPKDPDAGPAAGVPEGMAAGRAVSDFTDDRGQIAFPMGPGAFYKGQDGQRAPHALWIHGRNTHSDLVWGLGMLWATAHDHLDLVFRAVPHEPAPEPEPEPDHWRHLFQELGDIVLVLRQIRDRL